MNKEYKIVNLEKPLDAQPQRNIYEEILAVLQSIEANTRK